MTYAARRNRWRTRLSLLIMIAAVVTGALLGHAYWQRQAATFDTPIFDQSIDWIELVSGIGETLIESFVGVADE